jgi:hypothetical protein
MEYGTYAALLILAGLNVLQLILAAKERGKLLDRIQARSLGEYKAVEAREKEKPEKKEPKEPVQFV